MKPLLPSTAFFGVMAIATVMTFTSMVLVGGILESDIGPNPPEWLRFTAKIGAFILFLILAFSLTPLMLRGFLGLAATAGIVPASAPTGWRGMADGMTLLFWLIYLVGLLVAIPAISRDLF